MVKSADIYVTNPICVTEPRAISSAAGIVPATLKFRIRRKLKNLGFRAHTHLGRSTFLFTLYRLLEVNQDLVVTPATRLVIEGAARTATTFAYYSFLNAQPRPVPVSYHIHLPAQVFKAVKLRIPVLVTIRHPRDAVASAVVREPYMSIKAYLERYLVFYRAIEPFTGEIVMAEFAEVVEDFSSVVHRINTRFGCDFSLPTTDALAVDTVVENLRVRHRKFGGGQLQSYLPNPAKHAAKRQVDFIPFQGLLNRCEDLYRRYQFRLRENDGIS